VLLVALICVAGGWYRLAVEQALDGHSLEVSRLDADALHALFWTPLWQHVDVDVGSPLESGGDAGVDVEVGRRYLSEFCRLQLLELVLELESSSPSAGVSNRGGWQSERDQLLSDFHGRVPCVDELGEALAEQVREYLTDISVASGVSDLRSFPGVEIGIQAWANVNRDGHWNDVHGHPDAHVSGVYYLQDGLPETPAYDALRLEISSRSRKSFLSLHRHPCASGTGLQPVRFAGDAQNPMPGPVGDSSMGGHGALNVSGYLEFLPPGAETYFGASDGGGGAGTGFSRNLNAWSGQLASPPAPCGFWTQEALRVIPVQGMSVLFPSSLPHWVAPHGSQNPPRVSISFNAVLHASQGDRPRPPKPPVWYLGLQEHHHQRFNSHAGQLQHRTLSEFLQHLSVDQRAQPQNRSTKNPQDNVPHLKLGLAWPAWVRRLELRCGTPAAWQRPILPLRSCLRRQVEVEAKKFRKVLAGQHAASSHTTRSTLNSRVVDMEHHILPPGTRLTRVHRPGGGICGVVFLSNHTKLHRGAGNQEQGDPNHPGFFDMEIVDPRTSPGIMLPEPFHRAMAPHSEKFAVRALPGLLYLGPCDPARLHLSSPPDQSRSVLGFRVVFQ